MHGCPIGVLFLLTPLRYSMVVVDDHQWWVARHSLPSNGRRARPLHFEVSPRHAREEPDCRVGTEEKWMRNTTHSSPMTLPSPSMY